jgi:hypothetical protein
MLLHQNNITPESLPADLAQIVTVWPDLPKYIKTTIKMLAETASGKPNRTARKSEGKSKIFFGLLRQPEFKAELNL